MECRHGLRGPAVPQPRLGEVRDRRRLQPAPLLDPRLAPLVGRVLADA